MSMVVTDLDGTLLDSASKLGAANRAALCALGERGVLRVIATGRSLYSALRVLDDGFPIDYLVFGSGSGTVRWPSRELVAAHAMDDAHALRAVAELLDAGLDFMLHHAVPDNHCFHHHGAGVDNPDFERRRERYADFAHPWDGAGIPAGVRVSQLLAIQAPGTRSCVERLRARLPGHNVVLTTSPLDHASRWIEIFPRGVSKSQASDWLRRRHGIAHRDVLAVGNDHNDTDLLEWAFEPFVVGNAVEALRARFPTVASNDEQGFAQAVRGKLR